MENIYKQEGDWYKYFYHNGKLRIRCKIKLLFDQQHDYFLYDGKVLQSRYFLKTRTEGEFLEYKPKNKYIYLDNVFSNLKTELNIERDFISYYHCNEILFQYSILEKNFYISPNFDCVMNKTLEFSYDDNRKRFVLIDYMKRFLNIIDQKYSNIYLHLKVF